MRAPASVSDHQPSHRGAGGEVQGAPRISPALIADQYSERVPSPVQAHNKSEGVHFLPFCRTAKHSKRRRASQSSRC